MELYLIKSFQNENEVCWDYISKAFINHYKWNEDYSFVGAYAQIVRIINKGFIVKLVSHETSPWANYKVDGDPVYNDSCLEAFLAFDGINYINLETNSIGTRLQAIGSGRHLRHSLIPSGGFPVKVVKDDKAWSIEIFLDNKKLEKLYPSINFEKIGSGFNFLGNFYKTGFKEDIKEEHYGMWNEIVSEKPDFHRPEQFGLLVLE